MRHHHCLLLIFNFGLWSGNVYAGVGRSKWGTDIDSAECASTGNRALLPDILQGDVYPYAFNGPPEDCDAFGCQHLYWGVRCRWQSPFPSCPAHMRDGLVEHLKEHAHAGADWAKDALSLQPCELWEVVKGRTIWFVGDSISQETVTALLCFLVEYHKFFDPQPITDDPDLLHRLTHNANDKLMTTFCHELLENTKICLLRANFGPRVASVMLPALARLTNDEDIVVLNFGLWSNRLDELEMHTSMFKAAFEFHRHQLPNRTFWRETSAQHYETPSGMYNTSMSIYDQRCTPTFPGVNITLDSFGRLIPQPGMALPDPWSPDDWELQMLLKGGHRNHATQPAVDSLGLHTIRAWNISMAFWNYHHHVHDAEPSHHCATIDCDCTHVCSPTWPQMWLPQFLHAFSRSELWINAKPNATPS